LEVLTFIFYFILFSFLLTKINFLKNSGIEKIPLITLFSIKIIAGIAYAKFYTLPRYYSNSDTWRYYKLSIPEKKWLLTNPLEFIKDLFVYGYDSSGNLFSGQNTFWNDLKSNILVKMMAVMNVFTFNSYYSNIILFNFIFIFGLVALFRVFYSLFPHKKWLIIAGIFLLPSTLFWCSGIHKDGLILSALGLIIYVFNNFLKDKITVKKFFLVLFLLLLVFSLRNYILFALLPALLLWFLCGKFPHHKTILIIGIYLVGVSLFFLLPLAIPALNFPSFIVNKQLEFLQLEGGSEIKTQPLNPSFQSFIYYLPYALDIVFLQPHVTSIKNLSYLPAIGEVLLLNLAIILSILFLPKKYNPPPVILFCFAFSLSIMLICGYTIPFSGAIVRYRSIVLSLLLTPLLCITTLTTSKIKNCLQSNRLRK